MNRPTIGLVFLRRKGNKQRKTKVKKWKILKTKNSRDYISKRRSRSKDQIDKKTKGLK
jgi:hypothetical protein